MLIAPLLDGLMVAQTGCSHTEGIAWVRSLATRPIVARVGNLGPDVHVRVHASDAANVLLTRRGQLDSQVQRLVEDLTNLSPSPMKNVKWAPQKVAQNESRGVLLSEHALHEENGFARKGCDPAGKTGHSDPCAQAQPSWRDLATLR